MAMELLQLNFGEAETAAMVTLDDIIAEEEGDYIVSFHNPDLIKFL